MGEENGVVEFGAKPKGELVVRVNVNLNLGTSDGLPEIRRQLGRIAKAITEAGFRVE